MSRRRVVSTEKFFRDSSEWLAGINHLSTKIVF